MQKYVVRDYQKGVESDQARIGIEAARHWVWPFAYDQVDLEKIHAQPDFDPSTRLYCYLNDKMVGFLFFGITPSEESSGATAHLEFPRTLPGHKQAAELLVEKTFETLQKKGISRITGRVSTMAPNDIRVAKKTGFSIYDWGYKVYYSYEMDEGKLDIPDNRAREIDPVSDLEACARIATRWYKQPPDWCRARIAEWHELGLIAHLGIWDQEELIAACMTAPNVLRPATAANYYIFAPDENSLKPMLSRVVVKCIEHGTRNVIADLIHEHRQYEPVYQELGFKKVTEWARCEKVLT